MNSCLFLLAQETDKAGLVSCIRLYLQQVLERAAPGWGLGGVGPEAVDVCCGHPEEDGSHLAHGVPVVVAPTQVLDQLRVPAQ